MTIIIRIVSKERAVLDGGGAGIQMQSASQREEATRLGYVAAQDRASEGEPAGPAIGDGSTDRNPRALRVGPVGRKRRVRDVEKRPVIVDRSTLAVAGATGEIINKIAVQDCDGGVVHVELHGPSMAKS